MQSLGFFQAFRYGPGSRRKVPTFNEHTKLSIVQWWESRLPLNNPACFLGANKLPNGTLVPPVINFEQTWTNLYVHVGSLAAELENSVD